MTATAELTDGTPGPSEAPASLRAVHTPNFPAFARLGASLLVTTYQAGKLVMVRDEGDHLNTHFRTFPAPMGLAFEGDRLAIGTSVQVWEFVDVPAVTAKLEPPGRHDACFLPRSCHVTGNIQVHEMAWGRRASSGWSTRGSRACARSTARPASRRGGGRRSSRRWSRPTAATSTAWRWSTAGRATSRPWARPTAGRLAGGQGAGRHPDGRRQRRGDGARAVDAALAALVRRPALGLRVGGRHARLRRPGHRRGTSRSRRRRGSPAGWTSPATWRSSVSRRCARRPSSAASRSPSG